MRVARWVQSEHVSQDRADSVFSSAIAYNDAKYR